MRSPSEKRFFRRGEAAQWLAAQGLTHITKTRLSKLAHQGAGPAYGMDGNRAVYKLADLQSWLEVALRPPKAGCGPNRKAA